jgi:hypothetical protein
MCSIHVCATIAAWIGIAALLSGCSNESAGRPAVASLLSAPQQQPTPSLQTAPFRAADYEYPTRVRAEIIRYFFAAGYPRPQVEALVDYAQMESGFRPCAVNGSTYHYTYQWSGLRLRRLDEFARANGNCPALDKQLAFADRELRHEPNYSCFLGATTRTAALAALRRGFGFGRC